MSTRKSVEVTEPEVIDIPLIEECIIVVGGEKMRQESKELRFEDVLWLKLSFKNIVRIENLHGLHSLQKLQLDNNHIRKIVNLDHLHNLTWLDLSFNHIETLLGESTKEDPDGTIHPPLGSLTKITDLCLTHNKISKIYGIETLVNLEIFSCANNEIQKVEELMWLRQFEKLRVVNFQNNPVEKDQEYQPVLLAYLKHLKYLDFRLVDDAKVQQAQEQYFTDIQGLQIEEAEQEKKKKIAEDLKERDEQHSKANMPGCASMMKNMLQEDTEGEKLKLFPEMEDDYHNLQEAFTDAWDKFEKQMLSLYNRKEEEKKKFYTIYYGAIEAVDQKSKAMITDYKLLKKKVPT